VAETILVRDGADAVVLQAKGNELHSVSSYEDNPGEMFDESASSRPLPG
jgi:hypothetical protein